MKGALAAAHDATIRHMAKAGHISTHIAEATGIARATLFRYMRAKGIEARKPGDHSLPPNVRADLIARVEAGERHREVARALGISRTTVTVVIADAGLAPRSVPYTAADNEALRAGIAAGLSGPKLRDLMPGRSLGSIQQHIRKIGLRIPTRKKGTDAALRSYSAAEDVRLIELAAEGMEAHDMVPHMGGRSYRSIAKRVMALRRDGRIAPFRPKRREPVKPPREVIAKPAKAAAAKTKTPQEAAAREIAATPFEAGWPQIIIWWRENAPPSLARKWPQIGDVNELRKKQGRRLFAPPRRQDDRSVSPQHMDITTPAAFPACHNGARESGAPLPRRSGCASRTGAAGGGVG